MSRTSVVTGDAAFAASYRSIYILPTRYGLWFAAMLLVTLVAGINYSNGLAYGLTFLLTALALVAMLHVHRNMLGVRLRAGNVAPVFAGEAAAFNVVLENASALPRLGIELWRPGAPAVVIDVPARASATAVLPVPAPTRGRVALPPVFLVTRFPLSLWRAWTRRLQTGQTGIVYPTPAPLAALPPSWGLAGDGGHGTGTSFGDDFKGLREYRRGDPPMHIAWKALAAGRGYLTKQFSGGPPAVLWLDWAVLAGVEPEQRLSVLCRGVLEAERSARPYGLRLPGVELGPDTGAAHAARCLEALALYPRS